LRVDGYDVTVLIESRRDERGRLRDTGEVVALGCRVDFGATLAP
jgi:hypothetical protein